MIKGWLVERRFYVGSAAVLAASLGLMLGNGQTLKHLGFAGLGSGFAGLYLAGEMDGQKRRYLDLVGFERVKSAKQVSGLQSRLATLTAERDDLNRLLETERRNATVSKGSEGSTVESYPVTAVEVEPDLSQNQPEDDAADDRNLELWQVAQAELARGTKRSQVIKDVWGFKGRNYKAGGELWMRLEKLYSDPGLRSKATDPDDCQLEVALSA